ncbi:hypothetical protein DID88_000845 [Monilinia fructigena]|uniref:Uncharacterized protein n=1 Tax=Monilinia fructigena TaxID=38457 RepID=A0A395IYE0_9HELO|nr:hypothetical protein DID88_000845 [Monilinia fructigena]
MASQSYRPLDGKLAIVTGSSRGIGAAIAEKLASKGAKLVLNYTSNSSSALAIELSKASKEKHNIKTLVVQADVSEKSGAETIISSAKSHFSDSQSGNFRSIFWSITLAALDYLPYDRSGRIINISSVSSSEGFLGQTVYGGTKAAVDAMTRTWARELNNRATVNSVNPGPVKTDMWDATTAEFKKNLKPWIESTPGSEIRPEVDDQDLVNDAPIVGGRPAYTHEIAGVVGMLSTSDSVWCTGQVVCANGGLVLR